MNRAKSSTVIIAVSILFLNVHCGTTPVVTPPAASIVPSPDGTIYVPGATIVYQGKEYSERATVQPGALVGIIKDDQVFLYHSAMGNADLSEETSRRAVGYFLADSMNDNTAKARSTWATGDPIEVPTGLYVAPTGQTELTFENMKRRYAAVRGPFADQHFFLQPRAALLDLNIVQLFLPQDNFLTQYKPYINRAQVTDVSGQIYTYGSILPLLASYATSTDLQIRIVIGAPLPQYIQDRLSEALAAYQQDPELFRRLNTVDFVDFLVRAISNLTHIPANEICGTPVIMAAVQLVELGLQTAFTQNAQGLPQEVSGIAQQLANDLLACLATKAPERVIRVAGKLLDIVGKLSWIVDDVVLRGYDYAASSAFYSFAVSDVLPEGGSGSTTIITSTSTATVSEGSTAPFQVKLSSQPSGSVTVSVAKVAGGDQDISVQLGSSLTFTTSNWNTYQTVTLAAAEDADTTNGTATIRCSASGWTSADVTAIENDNDTTPTGACCVGTTCTVTTQANCSGAWTSGGVCSPNPCESGSIVAWGKNDYGQCNVPAPNSGFVGLAAGWYLSLGLKADGSIVAWGYNGYGQCNVPAPNSGFVGVAAGGEHNLGLKSDGSIVAWGRNLYGQCNVPAPNSGFVGLAAGRHHSLGLKADGSIVAWGAGGSGQSSWPHYGQSIVPAPNSGFVAVAADNLHSLGLKSDGSIVAWGRNDYGQCSVPAPNSDFVGLGEGGWHSLGLKAGGSIVAWGDNNEGQCSVPAPNSGFVGLAAGLWHSLGLKSDGSIVAWGYNSYGQSTVPAPNSGFVGLAAGGEHSLGLKGN